MTTTTIVWSRILPRWTFANHSVLLTRAAAIAFIFALGAASDTVLAQTRTGTLQGVTTAANTQGQNLMIGGVSLKLSGTGGTALSTFSDNQGKYKFVDLPAGSYTLEANIQGFKPVARTVSIAEGQTLMENITLQLEEFRQQLEVHESAPTISQQGATTLPTHLSSAPLDALPLAQQKFQQALPLTPGTVRTLDTKTHIKGSVENQGMLLLDSAENVEPVTGSFAANDFSIDAIESLEVYKTPYRTEYGGFSGGLVGIQSKPPSDHWRYGISDFIPGIRAKNGQVVGVSDYEPRFNFSGPLWGNKLSMSESFIYDLRKQPVRGLSFPRNEMKRQGFDSFTKFQYIVSPQHLLNLSVGVFPQRRQYENINSLAPQSASSDLGQRGFSIQAADGLVLASGGVLSTLFKYTRFTSYAHGQGSGQMLVTPNGWDGNFFNNWRRKSNQEEGRATYQLPRKEWLGYHLLKVGGDVIHRSFDGTSDSRPVLLLRPDASVAGRIDFVRTAPLHSTNTEGAVFVQDHWTVNDRLAFDAGLRYTGQRLGEKANFAPRLGIVFSLDKEGKTVFRSGAGVFHDRVSLLAGSFQRNPTRVVSFFDPRGTPLQTDLPFRNVCGKPSGGGVRILASCSDLDRTPYNVTWNVEIERRLPARMTLRLGYLSSRTYDLSLVEPRRPPGGDPLLLLTNSGNSRYYEVESTLHWRPSERSDLTVSYVHSHSRGDLNTLSEIFIPFEQPVIRPNVYANLPSDVPDRLVAWGIFDVPWKIRLSPVVDYHTGFHYSNIDVLQNYVGRPNSLRLPNFFSFDLQATRELRLPFFLFKNMKNHKFRLGFYVNNLTNHRNPHDVFNNVESPNFGNFVGFQRRVYGLVIDVGD